MHRALHFVTAIILASLALGFVTSDDAIRFDLTYTIEPQSNLYLKGTTNINSFECVALDAFPVQDISGTLYPSAGKASLKGAEIALTVKKLDCDNSKINRDLCDALNEEEYPVIGIRFHGARLKSFDLHKDWVDIEADATLTISGVAKRVTLHAKGKELSKGAYQFIGSKEIKMSDFGVDPPTALFGLIQVDDEVSIHLDVVTRTVVKSRSGQ